MTKAEMILEADKLDIANKEDLFDDILAGNVTETMLMKLQESDLKRKKETEECDISCGT